MVKPAGLIWEGLAARGRTEQYPSEASGARFRVPHSLRSGTFVARRCIGQTGMKSLARRIYPAAKRIFPFQEQLLYTYMTNLIELD